MNKLGVMAVLFVVACGSNDTSKKDSGVVDTSQHDSRPIDSSSSTADAALDAPPGTHPLTVKNFQAWCSVAVNGGTASTAATQMVFVAPGMINLSAMPASSLFQLGPNMWHHTTGDTGGTGENGTVTGTTSATTVTVGTGAKCAWVCCPFSPNGNGCESTMVPDQCP